MNRETPFPLRHTWRVLIAAAATLFFAPMLTALAGFNSDLLFAALCFGAILGVLDTIGVDESIEVMARVAVGLSFGGFLALAYLAPASPIIVMGVFTAYVVISRMSWMNVDGIKASNVLVAATVIGSGILWTGLIFEPAQLVADWGSVHPVFWGIFGGLGTLLMELPTSEENEAEQTKPLSIHSEATGERFYYEMEELLARSEGVEAEHTRQRILASVEAALKATMDLRAQCRLIARFNPQARRFDAQKRFERLTARAGEHTAHSEGSEVWRALREIEEEIEQCDKLLAHAFALEARQERLRSALERVRLDAIHRQCTGLYEGTVSSSLASLNELVETSVTEREIFYELVEPDARQACDGLVAS